MREVASLNFCILPAFLHFIGPMDLQRLEKTMHCYRQQVPDYRSILRGLDDFLASEQALENVPEDRLPFLDILDGPYNEQPSLVRGFYDAGCLGSFLDRYNQAVRKYPVMARGLILDQGASRCLNAINNRKRKEYVTRMLANSKALK